MQLHRSGEHCQWSILCCNWNKISAGDSGAAAIGYKASAKNNGMLLALMLEAITRLSL